MLVTIVAVPNADNTGLDLERLEKVEDIAPELALKMLDGGTARKPSDAELTAYHEAQDKAAEVAEPAAGDEPAAAAAKPRTVRKTETAAEAIADQA